MHMATTTTLDTIRALNRVSHSVHNVMQLHMYTIKNLKNNTD